MAHDEAKAVGQRQSIGPMSWRKLRDGPPDRQIRTQPLSVHRHVQRFVTWLYDHVDRGRAEGGRRCAAARRLGHDADDETLVHSEAEVERHARPLHARRRCHARQPRTLALGGWQRRLHSESRRTCDELVALAMQHLNRHVGERERGRPRRGERLARRHVHAYLAGEARQVQGDVTRAAASHVDELQRLA